MTRLLDVRPKVTVEYHPFTPPRKVGEYLGQAGDEPNGLLLPWDVLDAHGVSVSRRQPEQYAVIGEDRYSDGRRHLRFGIRREYIETTTNWRWHEHQFRLQCPACSAWDGTHKRGCEG